MGLGVPYFQGALADLVPRDDLLGLVPLWHLGHLEDLQVLFVPSGLASLISQSQEALGDQQFLEHRDSLLFLEPLAGLESQGLPAFLRLPVLVPQEDLGVLVVQLAPFLLEYPGHL